MCWGSVSNVTHPAPVHAGSVRLMQIMVLGSPSKPGESSGSSPAVWWSDLNPPTAAFLRCPRAGESPFQQLGDVSPCCRATTGDEVPSITVSLSLLPFFMWPFYPLLCARCSFRPPLSFGMNCCLCRCGFGMYVGRGGSGFSLLPSWTCLQNMYYEIHFSSLLVI